MRIRNISKENIANLGMSDKENKSTANPLSIAFSEQLHRVQSDVVHQKLESLFNDIDKQGKVLGEKLNLKELIKYKDMIQKFLEYAVNKMYQIKEQGGWDRRGKHKIYTMIETVNKEMENLTSMLLSEQKDKISILAKVDEIRGILIDIYS
jgi:uncharacterized protein YaaR (DUF327 family)